MWGDWPTTPQPRSRASCPTRVRFATSKALRGGVPIARANGGDHSKIEFSRRPTGESSKLTSRESAPLAEPSQSPTIRFDQRRSGLRRRERRRQRLPTKPIASRPRFFCASVSTLSYMTPGLRNRGQRSEIHVFYAAHWALSSLQKQASEITQTARRRRARFE